MSGAVEMLNELRRSQLTPEITENNKNVSRLDSYISKSKEQVAKDRLEVPSVEPIFEKGLNDDFSLHLLIKEIEPSLIDRWVHKDRPENELGDIEELAETFKQIGQQQPCIIRPSQQKNGRFELIVGERRWHAAEMIGVKLKVIIKDIDDHIAALIQAIENEKRQDLSEFAKGMSYADKINKNILSQKDLTEILGISKQQVTRLLSYKKIPESLFIAIKDFRKVSSRTAYEIARLANKSEINTNILIEIAERISEGKIGANTIEKFIEKRNLEGLATPLKNKKITSKDGRHLFTWRLDNNTTPSIHFPKEIIKLLNNNLINIDELTNGLRDHIVKTLEKISKSPHGDSNLIGDVE